MSLQYENYIKEHKQSVERGWRWMLDHGVVDEVNEWVKKYNRYLYDSFYEGKVASLVSEHDNSKYNADEYVPYDKYFYGGNPSYEVVEDFNKAFLLHIHRNPHHWQYWILIHDDEEENDGQTAIEMPLEYIYEMVCDWWAFSWMKGNLREIFSWYEGHRSRMILNDITRKIVELILNIIGNKLNELEATGESQTYFVETSN